LSFTLEAQNKETRELENFTAVDVSEGIHVSLTKGNKELAIIEASGMSLEDVETEVSAGNLTIQLKRNHVRNVDVRINLTYVSLERLEVSSAADVDNSGTIEGEKLDLEVSSAGDAKLNVNVSDLYVEVSSAGDLSLSGSVKIQNISVSSAGKYHAYSLKSEEAYVKASSAGSAYLAVRGKIEATAHSAGKINYQGDPKKVYVSSKSGGNVKKAN